MKFLPICITASCLFSALAPVAKAELPLLRPEELQEFAHLIVTGSVTAVDASTEGAFGSVDWVVVFTVEIDAVEKSDRTALAPGDTITVRCWQVKRRPSGWTGPSGHGSIPAGGSRVRLWLKPGEREEVWSPLLPNGIALLDDSPRLDFSQFKSSGGWLSTLLTVLVVAAGVAGVLTVVMRTRKRSRMKTDDPT